MVNEDQGTLAADTAEGNVDGEGGEDEIVPADDSTAETEGGNDASTDLVQSGGEENGDAGEAGTDFAEDAAAGDNENDNTVEGEDGGLPAETVEGEAEAEFAEDAATGDNESGSDNTFEGEDGGEPPAETVEGEAEAGFAEDAAAGDNENDNTVEGEDGGELPAETVEGEAEAEFAEGAAAGDNESGNDNNVEGETGGELPVGTEKKDGEQQLGDGNVEDGGDDAAMQEVGDAAPADVGNENSTDDTAVEGVEDGDLPPESLDTEAKAEVEAGASSELPVEAGNENEMDLTPAAVAAITEDGGEVPHGEGENEQLGVEDGREDVEEGGSDEKNDGAANEFGEDVAVEAGNDVEAGGEEDGATEDVAAVGGEDTVSESGDRDEAAAKLQSQFRGMNARRKLHEPKGGDDGESAAVAPVDGADGRDMEDSGPAEDTAPAPWVHPADRIMAEQSQNRVNELASASGIEDGSTSLDAMEEAGDSDDDDADSNAGDGKFSSPLHPFSSKE
jgi:hypothetical protein